MTRRFSLFAALLALVAFAPTATAQVKIGFADHEVILQAMPQMAQVRQALQADYQQRQMALQSQSQELQTKAEDYQRRQSLLTAEARQTAERELGLLQDSLQRASQGAEQAIRRREAELMQPLFLSLQNAIDAEAAGKGLDLVLPTRVNNDPLILFVNRERVMDITREVAIRLGINPDAAEAPAAPAAPAPAPARRN